MIAVSWKFSDDDVALCREKWPLVVTDDDQDVESILEAIVQTVLAVDGGMDARESDVTGMRVGKYACNPHHTLTCGNVSERVFVGAERLL